MVSGRIRIALCLAALVTLGACNTIEGVGRDVQSVGQAVEKTAQ
jgi:predicted small secreted protein